MNISLTTGVWGSFTTPRSRALGGKSGMTRAKPLVLIQPRPLHFADCLHLVFLALLSAFLWFWLAQIDWIGRKTGLPFWRRIVAATLILVSGSLVNALVGHALSHPRASTHQSACASCDHAEARPQEK